MATAAFNASSQPYTREQHLDRMGKQHAANLQVAADLKALYILAIQNFFAQHDPEQSQMGDTSRVAIKTLKDAFMLTMSMTESDVTFSQRALVETLEAPNAKG